MVVRTDAQVEAGRRADALFHALADPTRRDIVAVAAHGVHTVSALARRYPMSFAAVQKHVAVLERAGLVTKRRQGREQLVTSERAALDDVRTVLDGLEDVWRDRIDRFAAALADATPAPAHDTTPGAST